MATAPSGTEMASLISQLELMTSNIPKDTVIRQKLYDVTHKLNFALESAEDTLQRMVHLAAQPATARVAHQLDVFNLLVKRGDEGTTLGELVKQTGADNALLGRVMRYLASVGMVNEIALDTYAPSNITKSLSRPEVMGSIEFSYQVVTPCSQQLPNFLASNGYQNPSDSANSAFQLTFRTEKPQFNWLMDYPDYLKNFITWMTVQHEGHSVWLDVFPFVEELGHDAGPQTPLFVDVGGNGGHQCLLLKTRYPEITGRIILQDLAPVINNIPPMEGIEKIAHDFWTVQPVRGAIAYYMRNILHDYPDEKCITILCQITAAMTGDSTILIDEMVMPAKGAHWHATSLDISMMAILASLERTESHWRALLDSAGLKIVDIRTYNVKVGKSVVVARLKDDTL